MVSLTALRDMARLARPSASLPPSTLLMENDSCIAIFDKYPKAKYHVLVLPRVPFPPDTALTEGDLDGLASLLQHSQESGRKVIGAMAETAAEVEEMIRDEMVKTEGFAWGINMGFHSVPSMRHLHLHVISDDLVSPALKTKKHYNSFRPDLGFFVGIREVTGWLNSTSTSSAGEVEVATQRAQALAANHALMSTPLACFKCGEACKSMPALKEHLDDEFRAEQKKMALASR